MINAAMGKNRDAQKALREVVATLELCAITFLHKEGSIVGVFPDMNLVFERLITEAGKAETLLDEQDMILCKAVVK